MYLLGCRGKKHGVLDILTIDVIQPISLLKPIFTSFFFRNMILRALKKDLSEIYPLVVSDLDSEFWIGRYEPPKFTLAQFQ